MTNMDQQNSMSNTQSTQTICKQSKTQLTWSYLGFSNENGGYSSAIIPVFFRDMNEQQTRTVQDYQSVTATCTFQFTSDN